jgi:uncharacterized membrane protein YccC
MIGSRIHGTILGLMAGLPSMCLVIDAIAILNRLRQIKK